MSDKNQSSPEVRKVIEDAKSLYGSVVAAIKKAIADYKTPADNKPTENSTPPAPPSTNVIDTQPPTEQQPEQQPVQPSAQQQPPSADSDSTHKNPENKQ
ncbi:MAG: hypothetical protein EBY22_06270 [Gammaproteobacteria bacterium]|nr:hypothetical protein [Gammaproteobacteria bacterium]